MGNSFATSNGARSAGKEEERVERQGSAALGPFSFDEFSLLEELFLSLADAEGKHIDPQKFQEHFALEGADWFSDRLLALFLEEGKVRSGSDAGKLDLEGFREGVALTGRSSRSGMVQALYNICNPNGASSLDQQQLARLFEAAHCCCTAAWRRSPTTTDDADTVTASTSTSIAEAASGSSSENSQFRSDKLAESVANHLGSPLPSCAASLPPSLAVFSPPRPQQPSFLLDSHRAEIFGLALSTKTLQGPWMRIYNSEEDGLSFNRVAFKLVGYGGPTVILIRERESGAVWGGCADSPWKESNSFYGGEASFLFRLAPDFKIIPHKMASNQNFQYLNLKGFSLPHGFGMGGSTEAFRFFIPEALDDKCIGRSACLTFEQGELCPEQSRRFEVDILEVWGVGGEEALGEALEARDKQREYTATQIHKARQVDKSKFATNAFDKEFLLGKTFGGNGGHYNPNKDRRKESAETST